MNRNINCHEQNIISENKYELCNICGGLIQYPSIVQMNIKIDRRSHISRTNSYFQRRMYRPREQEHSDYESDSETY